jgi:hypothetical protein
MEVQNGMVEVACASETHKPRVPPKLGQAIPAKPRRSASTAKSNIACRFVGDATREIAGSVYVEGENVIMA